MKLALLVIVSCAFLVGGALPLEAQTMGDMPCYAGATADYEQCLDRAAQAMVWWIPVVVVFLGGAALLVFFVVRRDTKRK